MESAYGVLTSTVVCVRLFGPLEVSRRGPDGSWQVVKKDEWKDQGRPPRSVLKRLLTTPGRRLSRVDLEDDLWPDAGLELADQNLANGLMVIRRIIGKDLVETSGPLCGIVDQSQVWTDLDACSALLREAENHGCTTTEALPFLEEMHRYLERGVCLEDEGETWCHAVRTDAERMARQGRIWLAEGYELVGKLWQAGEVYRAMTRTLPPDEEALEGWLQMLARHGKQRDALQCYQDTKAQWEAQGFSLSQALEKHIALLEHYASSPSQKFPISKRSLDMPLWTGMDTLSSLSTMSPEPFEPLLRLQEPLLIDKETLYLFASLTDVCRHLSEGNELRIAERILWSYLPKVELIARLSSEYQAAAASIVSESYLLAASLVGHRNDLLTRLHHSEQALHYGELASDLNLQTVALRQIAISFDCLNRPDKVIETSQRAFSRLKDASPLLQACIYAGVSGAYAELGQKQDALRFIDMAYQHFPEHPENEPSYLHTICRYSTLIFFDGLNYLGFGQPQEAASILARIDGLHPKMALPERVRIELLNYQIEVFVALNAMEKACTYLGASAEAARSIGSERHFRGAFSLFRRMQKTWHREPRIHDLANLFM